MKNDERVSTTFWQDFSIADSFGKAAIQDTYNRAMAAWKTDYHYLTELVLVLNHKCWWWYEKGNREFSELYSDLYEQANDYALDNLKGDALSFYFHVTD